MQITVTIPDELVAQVQARGLTPEGYVENLLARHAEPIVPVTASTADRLAKFDLFLKKMAERRGPMPALPEEAYTRESFYQDHD